MQGADERMQRERADLQELLGLAVGGGVGEEVECGEAGLAARGHEEDGGLALARLC